MPNTKHNRKKTLKKYSPLYLLLFYQYLPVLRGKRKGNNNLPACFPIFLASSCPKTPVYQISLILPEVQSYVTHLFPLSYAKNFHQFFKICYRH